MAWLTYEYAFTKTGSIPIPQQYTYIIRLTVTVHTDYCARMELHLRNTATCQKAADVSLLLRDSRAQRGRTLGSVIYISNNEAF